MKVKEVIDKCIDLLEVDYTKDDLIQCFNFAERGLALDYIPLYAIHQCNSKVVYYDTFEYQPVRIVDCNCSFKICPTYLKGTDNVIWVKYTYIPNEKTLYDECSYNEKFLKQEMNYDAEISKRYI